MGAKEVIAILASYALGCFSTGYYLVRFRTGEDIRSRGSGSTGATNVGRELGVMGFLTTFLIDLAKGALAVWAAFYFGLGPLGVVGTMLAVVTGHIWPVPLRFKGGKGVATALGTVVVFDYQILIVAVIISCLTSALVRQFTLSGLIGVAISPGVAFLIGRPWTSVLGITVLTLLILVAHRDHIRAIFHSAARPGRGGKTVPLDPKGILR